MFRGARKNRGGPYSYLALVTSLIRIGKVKTVRSYNDRNVINYSKTDAISASSPNYTVFKSPNTRVKVTVRATVKYINGEAWGVYLYKKKGSKYVSSNKILKKAIRGYYEVPTSISLGKAEEVYNQGEEIIIGVSYDGALEYLKFDKSDNGVVHVTRRKNNNSKINIQIKVEAF